MFWKKYCFGRIMKYHIEIYHLFCRRLWRPAGVNFLKTGWWNSNAHYSWSHYNSSTIIQKHLDFSTPQSHLVSLVSLWNTLYSEWRLTLEKFWTFYSLSFLVNTKTSFNGINRFMTFFRVNPKTSKHRVKGWTFPGFGKYWKMSHSHTFGDKWMLLTCT